MVLLIPTKKPMNNIKPPEIGMHVFVNDEKKATIIEVKVREPKSNKDGEFQRYEITLDQEITHGMSVKIGTDTESHPFSPETSGTHSKFVVF